MRRGKISQYPNHYAIEMVLDWKSADMDGLMKEFQLAIVGSVRPGMPWSQSRLDNLESDLQHRFLCLLKNGGIVKRVETIRRRNKLGLSCAKLRSSLSKLCLFQACV